MRIYYCWGGIFTLGRKRGESTRYVVGNGLMRGFVVINAVFVEENFSANCLGGGLCKFQPRNVRPYEALCGTVGILTTKISGSTVRHHSCFVISKLSFLSCFCRGEIAMGSFLKSSESSVSCSRNKPASVPSEQVGRDSESNL